jgi:hypothetical protein
VETTRRTVASNSRTEERRSLARRSRRTRRGGDRKARNDHHHNRHDRNSDNAIEHGAPNQHLDGIDWRIPEREADHRGTGNDAVEPVPSQNFIRSRKFWSLPIQLRDRNRVEI